MSLKGESGSVLWSISTDPRRLPATADFWELAALTPGRGRGTQDALPGRGVRARGCYPNPFSKTGLKSDSFRVALSWSFLNVKLLNYF